MDGTRFERMVRSGLANLCIHEKEINDMNVFPVPDGDTGHNMRLTLENGINNAQSEKHLGKYLKSLSHGMLLGARGNSGVILSQLFSGMADELESDSYINAGELRDALIRAYKKAYSVVARPVEGTILTVAREGVEHIIPQIRRGTTVELTFSMYLAEMKKSVRNTPEMLAVLKESGVLDSGAVGYITIFDGMVRAMNGEDIQASEDVQMNTSGNLSATDTSGFDENSQFRFGYCTEFLLQLLNAKTCNNPFSLSKFKDELGKLGNSLVAIQSGTIVKIHVHTFTPADVIALAQKYGEFVSFKLENMQIQHNEFSADASVQKSAVAADVDAVTDVKELAVVAVADGDGISDILKGCGCDIVLAGGQTMNTAVQEFVSAYKTLDAKRIVVLPNNSNIVQSAVQAAEVCGMSDKITVIPTSSVIEGYYALAMGSVDIEDVEERISLMKDGAQSITTVSVAKAVKNYSASDFSCGKGDYIGFVGKKLISANADINTALVDALKQVDDLEDKGSFVVLIGANAPENAENDIRELLENEFEDIGTDVLYGGQQVYDVIVGVV